MLCCAVFLLANVFIYSSSQAFSDPSSPFLFGLEIHCSEYKTNQPKRSTYDSTKFQVCSFTSLLTRMRRSMTSVQANHSSFMDGFCNPTFSVIVTLLCQQILRRPITPCRCIEITTIDGCAVIKPAPPFPEIVVPFPLSHCSTRPPPGGRERRGT